MWRHHLRGSLSLTLEPRDQGRIARDVIVGDDLKCAETPRRFVPGLVHGAHAAFTNQTKDLVLAVNHLPKHRSRSLTPSLAEGSPRCAMIHTVASSSSSAAP